jgi:uncharacterized damage-inducible protein DinB
VQRAFIEEARRYLCREYPAKIRIALARLPEEDLWWRANEVSNSAGHLLLHLAGNVRQWVVHGLGGEDDVRDRAREFAASGGSSREELLHQLDESLREVDRVLEALDPERLSARLEIQGLSTTGMAALLHAVEHFSTHTGQILYIVKARVGADLEFYQVDGDGRVTGTRW